MFSSDLPAATINKRVGRGELTQLTRGVYTTEVDRDPAEGVREHLFEIVGRLIPGAVITDRSARIGLPVDGVLYVARPGRAREIKLPGLEVRARSGAGALPGDVEYPGGLYLASRPRGLAENSVPSRSRSGRQRRTLDTAELGDWIDFICQNDGPARLAEYRLHAERLAGDIGMERKHLATMQSLISIALGTRPADTPSRALAARQAGRPVDQVRVKRFELLAEALRSSAPQNRSVDPDKLEAQTYLPFYEAYFSNFIEGTEFDVDEAARIVFDGVIPEQRPADAHDIIGTYRLLANDEDLSRTGRDADEFIELLQQRNAQILEGRPEKRPGHFKELGNRAGATQFVDPALVEGTLVAGFGLRNTLDTPWERALYIMFIVSEVHPFDDGNGRTARAAMSAELVAGSQCRIIVPTVFRHDYLDGLRMLSRQDDPSVFIKAMRYAHDFTASIDFADYEDAKRQLTDAHAFDEPESMRRLQIPADRAT